MKDVLEYVVPDGSHPFGKWFNQLDAIAAAKVTSALNRLAQGNVSNVKPVGEGVSELKIDFGPGYRVYFGQDGAILVILLLGGTKKQQDRDIAKSKAYWADYKARKRKE